MTTESGFSSNRIKLKVRDHRDQCPEDEMSFCEGKLCGNWICLDGAKEHDSCELEFDDAAAAENISEKYRLVLKKMEEYLIFKNLLKFLETKLRTCSCHSNVGVIKIFVGCKWKR